MKSGELKKRLSESRPMIPITLRIPEDVIQDLKRIAPRLGFSGYQPLMRAYISQGLQQDMARLEIAPDMNELIESLRRHGVGEAVIADAMAEVSETTILPSNHYEISP